MIIEQLLYRNNHQDFLDKIRNAVIDRFVFITDENPTFDQSALPFRFRYCFCVAIYSDNGNFKLNTNMSNNGLETFWFSSVEENPGDSISLPVNAKLTGVLMQDGYDGYPARLQFDFGSRKIILYVAELYDNDSNGIDCALNDEMILAFENEEEALRFEKHTGHNF